MVKRLAGLWVLKRYGHDAVRVIRKINRRQVVYAITTGLLTALVVLGVTQSRVETGIDSFLPARDPAVSEYEELSTSFGGDPVVVLLETEQPHQLLEKAQLMRLLKLEGDLSRLPGTAGVYGPATTLNQIAGRAQELMAELSGRRDALQARALSKARKAGKSDGEVAAAVERATREFDRRYGQLLVQSLPTGLPTLSNQSFVSSVLFTPDGEPRPQWKFVVPSEKAVAIHVRLRQGIEQSATDELVASVRATVRSAEFDVDRVTVSGVPALAEKLGDKVRYEVPLLGGAALLAVGLCFLIVPWRRWRSRLLPLVSALAGTAVTVSVFGWLDRPLSLGVVAFLPVLLAVGSDFATYLTQRAQRRVVLAAACATSASFGALAISPVPFVRDLGIALSVGVLLSFLAGLLLAARFADQEHRFEQSVSRAAGETRAATKRRTVPSRQVAALFAVAVIAIAGWAMLPKLSVQSDLEDLVDGLPALAQAERVEHVLGASGEIALVMQGDDVTSPEALAWMRQARDMAVTRYGDLMHPGLSVPELLGFLGPSPSPKQIEAGVRLLPPYLSGAVLRPDAREAVMYFGVDFNDVAGLGQLRDGLMDQLPPPPRGYEVELTGLPILAARGYQLVSDNRYLINGVGIAAAGFVLALALSRRKDAVRAVTTAVLATGVCFFALWLTRTSLSPITVAVGPLVSAVGCEFTVLLSEAVRRRDRRLRQSVMLVAMVSAIGYLVLGLSVLAAIQQFGLLLAASVLLSLVTAMVVVSATTAAEQWPTPPGNALKSTPSEALEGVTR